jgi:hypothetical protein
MIMLSNWNLILDKPYKNNWRSHERKLEVKLWEQRWINYIHVYAITFGSVTKQHHQAFDEFFISPICHNIIFDIITSHDIFFTKECAYIVYSHHSSLVCPSFLHLSIIIHPFFHQIFHYSTHLCPSTKLLKRYLNGFHPKKMIHPFVSSMSNNVVMLKALKFMPKLGLMIKLWI